MADLSEGKHEGLRQRLIHNQVVRLHLAAEVQLPGLQAGACACEAQEGQDPEMQNSSASHFPVSMSAAKARWCLARGWRWALAHTAVKGTTAQGLWVTCLCFLGLGRQWLL